MIVREEMEPFTASPTPELPERNPDHRFHPLPSLPPLPDSQDTVNLIPPPLFSTFIKRTPPPPPVRIHATLMEDPYRTIAMFNADSSAPSSPTSTRSSRSRSPSQTSTPATSVPSSPTSQARSLSYAPSPVPSCWAAISWVPEQKHSLRRKRSPKKDTLRGLRAKESDACLQRIYDQQTLSYLDGSVFSKAKPGSRLGVVFED